MNKLFSMVFLFVCLSSILQAQQTKVLNDKVSLIGNFDMNFVLNAHYDKNKNCDVAEGYRIQIMNSSSREGVYEKKAEVYGHFNEFKGYIVYDQPYYKLRIGDFKTKLEARKYLDEVIQVFSTAFIVRDEIKIK